MSRAVYLKEKHWQKIEPLLPKPKRGRGRPPQNMKSILEGIMWVLITGARWKDLPEHYPAPVTCWRYLHRLEKEGVWTKIMLAFLYELNEQKHLRWDEGFIDGSFSPAKKGALKSEKPSGARVPRS
jgi:transposase